MASQIGQFKIPITLQDNWKTYGHDFKLGMAKIRVYIRKHYAITEYTAEVLKFSVGDGYAYYVVVQEEPFQIAHVAVGDNYTIPDNEVRKLTMDDVKRIVGITRERDRKLFISQFNNW